MPFDADLAGVEGVNAIRAQDRLLWPLAKDRCFASSVTEAILTLHFIVSCVLDVVFYLMDVFLLIQCHLLIIDLLI